MYKYVYDVTFDTLYSGSGNGIIELPTIVTQKQLGRTILFKADNSLSATKTVTIKSFGDTDPIEESTAYVMKNPYGWVELRADAYYEPLFGTTRIGWRVINSSHGGENVGNIGAYGSFYSTSDQALLDISQSQAVTLNGTYANDRVSISGSSAIVFEYAGTYQLSYVVQVSSLSNAQEDTYFWIKYNGLDFPNSTTVVTLQPRKNVGIPSTQLMTFTLTGIAQNNNDYIQLYWGGTSTDISLAAEPTGSNPTRPATPSVIANIIHVS